jgi:hypothetical protein
MSEVFVAERGQLDERSKRDLRKAGVVVVEVEDLTKAQFIRATHLLTGDDMLVAAMRALRAKGSYSSGDTQRQQLAENLIQMVDAAYGRRPESRQETP